MAPKYIHYNCILHSTNSQTFSKNIIIFTQENSFLHSKIKCANHFPSLNILHDPIPYNPTGLLTTKPTPSQDGVQGEHRGRGGLL